MPLEPRRNEVTQSASSPGGRADTDIAFSITIYSPGASRSAPEVYLNGERVVSLGSVGSVESSTSKVEDDAALATSTCAFKLTRCQRLLAGSGHVLNDLISSLWFTYLLLYLQKVVKFNDAAAAGLLFYGEVVDGLLTPVVGYGTDHVKKLWPCPKTYGRCKSWHLLGIILQLLSFPFIFSPCPGYSLYTDDWSKVADWKKGLYYSPFIAMFQIGWACTEVAHLALIPKLTPDDMIRTEILSIRYAFTVGANITVFVLTWLFLTGMGKDENCSVGADDSSKFNYIALISVGIGIVFSILFHWRVVELPDQVVKRSLSRFSERGSLITEVGEGELAGGDYSSSRKLMRKRTTTDLRSSAEMDAPRDVPLGENEENTKQEPRRRSKIVETVESLKEVATIGGLSTKTLNSGLDKMRVKDWMKLPQFYMVACMYLGTKMAVNLAQSYMPLYVETTLRMSCGNVAVIPLIMYCSGLAISLAIKSLNKHLGRQLAFTIGAVLIIVGAGMILFMDWSGGTVKWAIYVVAVLLGGGLAVILVTSLSIAADLIGNNIESGAFVYGFMSFTDKFFSGLGILIINSLNPCQDETESDSCTANRKFYTDALGYSSGVSTIFAMIFIVIITIYIFKRTGSKQIQDIMTS